MTTTQLQKARAFRALHERAGAFIVPNPWDAGTARILAALGFEALATTSLGLAASLGRPDGAGAVSRREVLDNCAVIAAATELPVSADLENCYAHEPRAAAEMIRLAAEAGVVGGSIEDATGNRDKPIYDFQLAVERVQAAVETARSLAISVRADRAGRELPARPARSRRHDPPAAGVRESRRRRALCAGAARPPDDPHGCRVGHASPSTWSSACSSRASRRRSSRRPG